MSEASVIVTFPYLQQALEFQKIVKAMIDGMPKVISIPKNWLVDFQLKTLTRKGGFTIAMRNIIAKIEYLWYDSLINHEDEERK